MKMDHPLHALALLIVCALAAAAVVWAARNRRRGEAVYSNLALLTSALRPQPWIERALFALLLLGLSAIVVAFGGPHMRVPILTHDGAVFICIDTSGSMAATDVAPTRARAAASAARAFVASTPQGTHVGLIAFAGFAAVVQPLTTDRAQMNAAIDSLPPPNGGTAIGDALALAAQRLPRNGHRVVVVVTDGINNRGTDPLTQARVLGAHHIAIYTVGIGTTGGGLIPGTDQQASIDEGALRAYAQAAGGTYARVGTAGSLRDALAQLGRTSALTYRPVDASLAFALAGAAAIFLAGFAGLVMGRLP